MIVFAWIHAFQRSDHVTSWLFRHDLHFSRKMKTPVALVTEDITTWRPKRCDAWHDHSDSRSVLHRLWERTILSLWCSQGTETNPFKLIKSLKVCSMRCSYTREDTLVCMWTLTRASVCVMIWCTLEKIKYHSHPLSRHEPNHNKHFNRTKCLTVLISTLLQSFHHKVSL